MDERKRINAIDELSRISAELKGVSQMLGMARETSEAQGLQSEYLRILEELTYSRSEELMEIRSLLEE